MAVAQAGDGSNLRCVGRQDNDVGWVVLGERIGAVGIPGRGIGANGGGADGVTQAVEKIVGELHGNLSFSDLA
jgi:hypothetical protein